MESLKALIIIDMLNDFVNKDAPLKVPGIENTIKPIKREIKKIRHSGDHVIYLCDSHTEDDSEFEYFPPHAIKGSPGSEIIDELSPESSDIIINKKYYSGFYKTDLEDTLNKKGCNSVIICGCVINICVLFTAVDAFMRGLDVTVIRDAVASFNKEDHDYMIRYFKEILKIRVL